MSFSKINWKIMISVMLFVIFQSAFMAFSSVLADIAIIFPEASATMIQMILTIPSLVSIPISLFAGVLASYVTKKNLVLVALVSELVGGVLPVFFHSTVYALIISSALIGIGQGFLISIASAILAEHFEGNTRGAAMGIKQAASSVGIAVLTILTGYLCTIAWYKAYYVYLFVIPIIVLVALMLPKGELDVKIIGKGVGASGLKTIFTPGLIYLSVLFFFLGAFNFAFYTNIGMSIMGKGLGDASAIGVAAAWNSVMTVIIGLLFGVILKMFKKFTLASAMLIVGISYVVLAWAPSLGIVTLGGIIYGLGAGIQMPASVFYVTESVESNASSLAIAVSMSTLSLGITMSPMIVNALAGIFGEIDGTTGLMVAAGGYFTLLVVEMIREALFNKDSRIGLAE